MHTSVIPRLIALEIYKVVIISDVYSAAVKNIINNKTPHGNQITIISLMKYIPIKLHHTKTYQLASYMLVNES
jgi:hypothetical protein